MKSEQLYGGPIDGLETTGLETDASHVSELTAVIFPADLAGVPTWTLGSRKRHTHRARYIRRNGRLIFAGLNPQPEASWA